MKLSGHFDTFLKDIVNLNDTRIQQLDDSIDAIKNFIRASDWQPRIRRFAPQGSWAHKTIIRPVEGAAFDADLLVFVDPVDDWEPKAYIDELYDIFKNDGTYKDKVRRYSHCVTIEYAGERKIDIAPCVLNRGGFIRREVCNRTENEFERSEPEKYTEWLIERNQWSGSNSFRKTTRLLKYLRDIKGTFTCPSVLLTTLLGYRMMSTDEDTEDFADVPSALKTIVVRLDDWLQARPNKPDVPNPFLSSELFSDAWDQEKYANFREKIHTYRDWIVDALDEPDRDESIGKWRRVFGDDFASGVVLEEGRTVSTRALATLQKALHSSTSLSGDLVSLVQRMGARVIPPWFDHLPYMQRPKWRVDAAPALEVEIVATLHEQKNGAPIRQVPSLGIVQKNHWLKFHPRTRTGAPLPTSYEVQWRITNTDQAAFDAKCLRGDFYPSNDGNDRWESLLYRGVHLAEAFVIRKRDNVMVGQSAAFRVVIE